MALKNRVRYTSTIAKENMEKLKELSEATRIAISKLMDEALEDLFDKHEKKPNS